MRNALRVRANTIANLSLSSIPTSVSAQSPNGPASTEPSGSFKRSETLPISSREAANRITQPRAKIPLSGAPQDPRPSSYDPPRRDNDEPRSESPLARAKSSSEGVLSICSGQRLQAARKNGTVVVFFSSTFKDFQLEREELHRWVFPQLKRLCVERGMFFVAIDLRWGVTKEAADNSEVMELCLQEIGRSTYFVGMCGERYGWHQPDDAVTDSLLASTLDKASIKFPWVGAYRDRSVTELEFRHGSLNDVEANLPTSLFYFRSRMYRPTAVDEVESLCFQPESPEAEAKLARLKQEVTNAGFLVRDDYASPSEFARLVLQDLTAWIERDFPTTATAGPRPAFPEINQHEAFQESQCRFHFARGETFQDLDRMVDGPQAQPLYVVGPPGCGKTALLANWIEHRRRRAPEQEAIYFHFAGTSSCSTYSISMILRFLRLALDLGSVTAQEILSSTLDDLDESSFSMLLHAIAAELRMPILIVLDALDQVVSHKGLQPLHWLPSTVPPNVKMVASCSDEGSALSCLQSLGWRPYVVRPLCASERGEMARVYLGAFGRHLDADHIDAIQACERCAIPLFLRLVLDILMAHGSFERLSCLLGVLLARESLLDLYEDLLDRLEQQNPAIKDLLLYLHCARFGLTEEEAQTFLGLQRRQLEWCQLFASIREHLVPKRGLFVFSHKSLHQAVCNRYISANATEQHVHQRLASLFPEHCAEHRVLIERPWHLLRGAMWPALFEFLSDPTTAVRIFEHEQLQLFSYWSLCGRNPKPHYQLQVPKLLQNEDMVTSIGDTYGTILRVVGAFEEEELLRRKRLDLSSRTGAVPCQNDLNGLATALSFLGSHAEARNLYNRVLAYRKETLGAEHPDTLEALHELSLTFQRECRFVEAKDIQSQVLAMRERVLGAEHPDTLTSVTVLAVTMANQGKLLEAKEAYERVLAAQMRLFGTDHPITTSAMFNLADCLLELGLYAESEALMQQVLAFEERMLGAEHSHTTVTRHKLSFLTAQRNSLQPCGPTDH